MLPCRDPPMLGSPRRPSASAKATGLEGCGANGVAWLVVRRAALTSTTLNLEPSKHWKASCASRNIPQHFTLIAVIPSLPSTTVDTRRLSTCNHGTVAPLCASALLRRLFACMLDPQIRNRGRREQELHRPHTSGSVGPHFQANTVNRPSVGRVGVRWAVGGFAC